MGKVAVVKHGADEITLSMVRWRARRLMLYCEKKLGLINSFDIALFVPKYEIAVYEGGPGSVFTKKPEDIFFIIQIKKSHMKNLISLPPFWHRAEFSVLRTSSGKATRGSRVFSVG